MRLRGWTMLTFVSYASSSLIRMAAHDAEDRRPPPWTWNELILACDVVVSNGWRSLRDSDPRIVELSELLRQLDTRPADERGMKFRNLNGVKHKLEDLITCHPAYSGARKKGGRLTERMVVAFLADPAGMAREAARIRTAARRAPVPVPEIDLDFGDIGELTTEGREAARQLLVRERNPRLRARKIRQAKQTFGAVRCEACEFDFEKIYGERGRDYIECHHRTALSVSGETETTLADLALVCSNCHRMIHRKQPWLTVEELRQLVAVEGSP